MSFRPLPVYSTPGIQDLASWSVQVLQMKNVHYERVISPKSLPGCEHYFHKATV